MDVPLWEWQGGGLDQVGLKSCQGGRGRCGEAGYRNLGARGGTFIIWVRSWPGLGSGDRRRRGRAGWSSDYEEI